MVRGRRAAASRGRRARPARSSTTSRSSSAPARSWASWRSRGRVRTSCSRCSPALAHRPRELLVVDGTAVKFSHPADAIRAGLVYVPANRAEALLPQRSVRENIALPSRAREALGAHPHARRAARSVGAAIQRLQIDTRAQSEVRRLSGGNQQKVTIARWIGAGVKTLLCFDPTRGIDIRTKREIYQLLRDLAAGGAAVLLYTSELEEIQLACDRAVVIFGGRVVDELTAAEADEPTLLRAAYGLPPGAVMPRKRRGHDGARGARAAVDRVAVGAHGPRPATEGAWRSCGAAAERVGPRACWACWSSCSSSRSSSSPTTGPSASRRWPARVPAVAFAAVAQAIVVIAGGIDLSVGAVMAFANVTAAVLMERPGSSASFGVVVFVLLLGVGHRLRQRRARRHHARAGHRRDARDVVRVGRGGAAGAPSPAARARAGSRRSPPAACSSTAAQGARRPDGRRRRGLAAAPPLAPGPVAVLGRQRPAGGVPKRRPGRADEGRVVRAGRAVRGGWRPRADDDRPASARRSPRTTRSLPSPPSCSAA